MVEVLFYTDSKDFLSQSVQFEKGISPESESNFGAPFISAFELSGHAMLGKRGKDIACAAISSAVFAYLDSIESNPFVSQQIATCGRGNLSMKLVEFPQTQRLWLLGLQSALVHALNRVKKEYPKSISIQWVSENKLDCQK